MRNVCSFCKREIRDSRLPGAKVDDPEAPGTSHGVCESCMLTKVVDLD